MVAYKKMASIRDERNIRIDFVINKNLYKKFKMTLVDGENVSAKIRELIEYYVNAYERTKK